MGQKIDLSYQVQGILPLENVDIGSLAGLQFADAEIPSGAVNGINTTFTLAQTPSPALSLLFFVRPPGSFADLWMQNIDYTLSGKTVNTTAAPVSGANIRAWYRWIQTGVVVKFEIMFMADAMTSSLQPAMLLTDAFVDVSYDNLNFVLAPSRARFGERIFLKDSMAFSAGISTGIHDALLIQDGFASVLM